MALTRVTSGGIAEGVQIKFDSANTPTTPAIAFENDPNTGIYQNAADELSIATAGVRRVTFKADGSIETGNGTILGGTNPDFDNAQNITLYVNQSDKNASDATANDGGNLNKPFKTIERALLEAAKRSYKLDPSATTAGSFLDGKTYTITTVGNTDFTAIGASSNTVGVSFIATGVGSGTGTATLNNDKFEAFTIMVLPGQYEIDNRPGLDVFDTNVLTTAAVEDPSDGQGARTISDLEDGGTWRFNSRNGGVIVPRGTSIVGYDLRKTVIRPKYVPAPFSVDGSITSDSYTLRHVSLDGAVMIERSRGYIVEQARLAMVGGYDNNGQNAGSNSAAQAGWNGLTSAQEALCIRDIGYFVDALIKDLREGGNENTFVNAESYVDGNGYRKEFLDGDDNNLTNEIAATRLAFAVAVNSARHIVKSHNDGSTYYHHISGGSISQPSFTPGDGYVSNGDCTEVVNAVAILGAIADGIISNPNTYTAINTTYTKIGIGAGTITIPLRKVQGVYEQTAIFKVTGGCYFWQMTFKDALGTPYESTSFDTNGIPTHVKASNSTYSHHRVVAFTYADQRNTDGELDQYYGKIDAWQGRTPPGDLLDVRTEEFQIVGDRSKNYTIDTVNSCSPYIFNCSLRSVFGMCGMHTDGSKVAENSFKSMVVAQFTGISLQKDRNVFIQPKDAEGDRDNTNYNDDDPTTAQPPIFADPDGQYKTDCRHFHIKASNGGFIQVVSVFAVGYADQFLAESGGDMSITNSNSNFGQLSLRAKGSQFRSFKPSAQGRITALIPPRGISDTSVDNSFYSIDAVNTWGQEGLAADAGDDFTDELKGKLANFKGVGGFKLYLQTGATSEADIPELVVTSYDHDTDTTVTKRFLTYGSQGEFALFRDFYQTDGITPSAYQKLKLILETSEGGGSGTTFNISLDTDYDSVSDNFADEDYNSERIGYYWDPNSSSVYIKLENDTATNNFLDGFIFASDSEQTFTFETVFDSNTGATTTQLVSGTKDTLRYRQGFPSNLLTTKYFDDRDSSPEDLLWRVEYTIPKYLASGVNPKPPEKRFIIKGTRPDNGEDNVPYSDYRFMIWDVQEVQAWERNTTDGIYYLTIVRADVNKFVDVFDSVNNVNSVGSITRRPLGISVGQDFECENIESVNLYDKDTKLLTNVNYLYPSVNQEAPTYNTRTIWNPPQSDSRVMTETIGVGRRIKDISVPNFKRYHLGNISNSPFKDIPALQSVTAETIHRLVQALDLRYVIDTGSFSASADRVSVAPVASWDGRASQSALGYTSSNIDLYSSTRRFGYSDSVPTGTLPENAAAVTKFNNFGVQGEPLDRRIIVCSLSADGVNSSTRAITANVLQNNSQSNPDGLTFAPVVPLYRPSILRASSHTWEYIGLGSGNYSTGFPNLQTRVLKLYEQFIAQGYENAGGFVASSGTNSAGDFYIGNQVIQAGGTSTVTLNVPKVRKSSESNFVDIENIENRISNAVINITTTGRATAQQNALKDLTNFFNIQKLTVSDTANITNLITDRFFINRSEINNAGFFPEGNTSAYGFVKGAKPEKTGFISTDTNDKLYVSPKYLDAWRVKRQLISAAAVTLDNNRVYIQPYLQSATEGYVSTSPGAGLQSIAAATALTYDATTVNGVNASTANTDLIKLNVVETAGLASFGKVDVSMSLTGIGIEDYYLDASNVKYYLNPKVTIPLSYESVDYTTNEIVLSKTQNGVGIIDYLKSYISGTHNKLIKNYPPLTASGAAGIDASESDVKFLKAKLHADFNAATGGNGISSTIDPDDRSTYATIQVSITTQAEYDAWPDRGSISLREYQKGGTYYISSYKYRKAGFASNIGSFELFDNYGAASNNDGLGHTFTANYDNNYPGVTSKNVFFTGCDSLIFDSDRWTSESPFIPPLDPTKGVVEEVNIEDAILYRVPDKKLPIAVELDEDYFDRNLPNPYSSKALGVNIQERNEVKRFSPLFSFSQCKQWADQSGFGSNDELELLMKPGYYKMDGSSFPCSVKINGTGVQTSSIFAGKEQTRVSAGRMGGYLEDSVKRGDSVYLYRTLGFTKQYGPGNDAIYSQISGGLTADGSFNLSNVHLLGINESITKNEIPDSVFSDDKNTQDARRVVRNAYFTKGSIKKESNTANSIADPITASELNVHKGNTLLTSGLDGAIDLTMKQAGGSASNHGAIAYPVINSGNIIENDPSSTDHYELNTADFTNCRYFSIEIKASDFAGDANTRLKFDRMRKYIVPGTTMYYLTNPQDLVVVLSDQATVSNLTVSTKVLSVRKVNPSVSLDFDANSQESIQVLVSVYRTVATGDQTSGNSGSYTNDTEDLNTGTWNASDLRKIVFMNEDGAEYTTLLYNWAVETRRDFLPKGFLHEGGYQGPILKKVVTAVTGGVGVRLISVDSVRDIEVGDRIAWIDQNGDDQLNNFRVSVVDTVNKTISVSDDIPAGVTIGVNSIVSITKFDVFGDVVTKYDSPEIYGILRSAEADQLVLVVDRNPNKEYDTTILPYPYASGSFGAHPTQLIQLKHEYDFPESTASTKYGSVEDASLAFNRVKASYQRVNGIENDRFLFIDVNPRGFATLADTENDPNPQNAEITGTYLENAGIHRDILVDFANFDQQSIANGGAFGRGFTQTTVTVDTAAAASQSYADIRSYIETQISNAVTLTSTRNFNSRLRVVVSGVSVGNWRFYANINTNPNHGTYKMGEITQIRCYSTNQGSPTAINGDIKIDVIDGRGHVLSRSGRTVSTSSTIGSISSTDFTAVAKANLLAAAKLNIGDNQGPDVTELGSPYLESVLYDDTYTDDPIVETARGKKIYNSWPKSYRTLRRRFPLAGMPINGNYQSTMISVNSLPGSNFKLNLTGVTIGAQSPADSRANTFGGGYGGGLIKCRGAQLTLKGTRFRGNLSLDWMGIGTTKDSNGNDIRAKASGGGSFVAGHSIEMFQMEDQNSFQSIGGDRPAQEIRTSNLDEEFRQLTEFDPVSNVYLEPSKDPYGRLSDGDARTFPLNTRQAIRRFNKSNAAVTPWTGQTPIASGALLDKLALFERYQTPYGILYDAPSGDPVNPTSVSGYIPTANGYASGVMLRWRDTSAAVTYTVNGGDNISLPTRTLGFFVVDDVAGQDIPSNIFFGKNATGVVKAEKSGNDTTTFVESTYALVKSTGQSSKKYNIADNTGVITESVNGKYIFIQVTFDRNNAFDPLSEAAGTLINFNTDYLDAKRYNYVSTVTSRYAKSTENNFAKLILEETDDNTVYSQPANYAINNENNTCAADYTTSTELYLVNETNTTTAVSGRVLITTNSARKITSLYITDPGQNHSAGDVLHISTTTNGGSDVCNGLTLKIRNNYSNEDFSIFNKGEYKVMLPKNCFILNSIENGSSARQLKQQINAAKAIFKPGSYILHRGLYYKIAKSDASTNKSYIGVYRYINDANTTDIRADIVVELDDISFNPTYGANTRFDLFDNDNLLNYWPADGRLVIGNRETCDYEKAGSASDPKGFEIRLTRSMTKYWPHYIRDWEGLDPNNATDDTVSSESIIPTEIRMADPVDVTCYGLKRFHNSDFSGVWSNDDATQQADIVNRDVGHVYVTPTGIKTNQVAEICIKAADGTGIIADNEKLSIGQTVTIPYRDTGSNWSTFKVNVGDPQGIPGTSESTNRAGDLTVSGTFKAGFTSSVNSDQTFNLHGDSNNDTKLYGAINPLVSAKLVAGSGTSLRVFDAAGGFRMWGYRSARAGGVIQPDDMPNESQSGTTYKSIAQNAAGVAGVSPIPTNKEGALAFTVNSGYFRSMIDIGSWSDFNATFTQIDINADSTECIMDVTAINDGAIYRGQPIYAGGTAPSLDISSRANPTATQTHRYDFTNVNNGTFNNIIGWVVGFDGDTISTTEGTQDGNQIVTPDYEDDLELTGRGGTGRYRVLLNESYNNPNGTFSNLTFSNGSTSPMSNVLGKMATTDYFPYGANQAMWWNEPGDGVYRYIWKRRVLDDGTNIVYFRYSNNKGAGLTALYNASLPGRDFTGGDTSLYSGAYVLFYYQGRRSNTIKLALDKPLCEDLLEGTTYVLAPTPNRDSSGLKLFKSRILDIKKSQAHSKSRLKITLADPLPPTTWNLDNSDTRMKTFGYMYINDGGWTYPKTGGSAFRAQNVRMTNNQAANTILLPNFSGRIRAGDKITYTWQDILRIQSNIGVLNIDITVASGSKTVTVDQSASAANRNLVHKYIRPGYTIFAENGGTFTELGTCESVDTTTGNITLAEETLTAIGSNQSLHYTTTGETKSVSSTITTVDAPDTHGYCECTLASTGNHILTGYTFHNSAGTPQDGFQGSQHPLLSTIGDVFVAHRAGNFQNDGPITKTFIYSDTGVKLTFGEYRLWYENYSNYIQPHDRKKQAISGRQGWVGNFGLDTNGRKTLGIDLKGASSLQLGRQYNGSIWLTAVPVHALWEHPQYSRYMLESDHASSIDSNYLTTTSTRLDGSGNNQLYSLNHTRLTTGAIYGALNTGDVVSGGSGAYDTHHYQFASTGIRLKYSLQNGTVNSDGSVTGGSKSRLSEQLVINKVTNYKAFMNSLPAGKGLANNIATTSAVATTDTVISVSSANSKKFLPGDCVYTHTGSSDPYAKIGNFIGIVQSVDYSAGDITLTSTAKVAVSNGGLITAISASGFYADNGAAESAQKFDSQTLVFTGESGTGAISPTAPGANTTSPNVIGNNEAGFNRYNFRFGVDKRVYNQSTLLNTYTNLAAVNSYTSAPNVVDVRFGDLATYTSPLLNIEVTRFNAKTHIESSISVVGSNLHI